MNYKPDVTFPGAVFHSGGNQQEESWKYQKVVQHCPEDPILHCCQKMSCPPTFPIFFGSENTKGFYQLRLTPTLSMKVTRYRHSFISNLEQKKT